jgi:hypothetical protein
MKKYFLTILCGVILCQVVCATHQPTEKEDYSLLLLPIREAYGEKDIVKLRKFVNSYYHVHLPFYDEVVSINKSFAPNETAALKAHRILFIPKDIRSQIEQIDQKNNLKFNGSGIDLRDHSSTIYEDFLEECNSSEILIKSSSFLQKSIVNKNIVTESKWTQTDEIPFYKSSFFKYPLVATLAGLCVYFYMKK